MNRRLLVLAFAVLVIGLCFSISSWSVSESEIVGTYVNRNYRNPIAELPHMPDTLVLLPQGHLISRYYGRGSYTIEMHGLGKKLLLKPGSGSAVAPSMVGIDVSIDRDLRLIMSTDFDQYYEKLE